MENICFVDTNFGPLDENNILDYFSSSPFYDSSCNNEVLKMQSQYTGNKISQQVSTLKGIYFALEYKNQDNTLFIIRKSLNTGDEHLHLNFYYVIFGHVYESPTNILLFQAKVTEAFWQLNKLVDLLIDELDFDPLGLEDTKEKVEDGEFGIIRDIFEMFNKQV